MTVFVCTLCDHLISAHGLANDGDLRDGPYVCPCGCEIAQHHSTRTISNSQYDNGEGFTPPWPERTTNE